MPFPSSEEGEEAGEEEEDDHDRVIVSQLRKRFFAAATATRTLGIAHIRFFRNGNGRRKPDDVCHRADFS